MWNRWASITLALGICVLATRVLLPHDGGGVQIGAIVFIGYSPGELLRIRLNNFSRKKWLLCAVSNEGSPFCVRRESSHVGVARAFFVGVCGVRVGV